MLAVLLFYVHYVYICRLVSHLSSKAPVVWQCVGTRVNDAFSGDGLLKLSSVFDVLFLSH